MVSLRIAESVSLLSHHPATPLGLEIFAFWQPTIRMRFTAPPASAYLSEIPESPQGRIENDSRSSDTTGSDAKLRRAANENLPVAELAKSFEPDPDGPKVCATSATAGKSFTADRLRLPASAVVNSFLPIA